MPVDVPDDFAGRLRFALKTLNLSSAALGAAVGVDKSVISRWLSGKVLPSGHNLSRIGVEIARHRPGFSTLAFEAPREVFLAALGLDLPAGGLPRPGAGQAAAMNALSLPHDAIEDARNETARRGMEYFGHYAMYYWSFSRPGQLARMALMLRPENGLIQARYGANGFEFGGWALLLLNRLYIQFSEKRFQAMVFMVTNPGQQPVARQITGLLMGPSDRLMVPTVSPMVMVRVADVNGDPQVDNADFLRLHEFDPFTEGLAAPADLRDLLTRMAAVTPAPGGHGAALVQVSDPAGGLAAS